MTFYMYSFSCLRSVGPAMDPITLFDFYQAC